MPKKVYNKYPVVYVEYYDHHASLNGPNHTVSELKKIKPLRLGVFGLLVGQFNGHIVVTGTLEMGYCRKGVEQDTKHEVHVIVKSTIIHFKQFHGPKIDINSN